MRSKRVDGIRVAAGLLLVVPALLGVSSTARPVSAATARHGTTTLTIWYSTDDPVETTWAQGLVPLFEKANPSIDVNMKVYDLDDFNTKMQDALASKTGPDLAYATPRAPGIPTYVVHNELANFSSYAKTDRWGSKLRSGLLTSWNEPFQVWTAHGANPGGSSDSLRQRSSKPEVFGVPDALAVAGLAYNSRLLSQLHVDVPKTLGALKRDATLAKKAHMIPFGIGNQDLWVGDDWYQSLVNESYTPAQLQKSLADKNFNFNAKPFVQAGDQLSTWRSDGYFTPNFSSLDAQGGMVSFFQGHTLFQLLSSSEDGQVLQDEDSTHMPIGITAFPASLHSYHGIMLYSAYEGWVVPKTSHHISAAVKWINFMLGSAATTYLLNHGVLPAVQTPSSAAPTDFQRGFLNVLSHARHAVYFAAAPLPNFNATMEANLESLLGGSETGAKVAKQLEVTYKSSGKKANTVVDIDGEY
jgi:ABC-type glycerol-3-phosphate transport system substrate-binding protein